jgi:hypothetical protein
LLIIEQSFFLKGENIKREVKVIIIRYEQYVTYGSQTVYRRLCSFCSDKQYTHDCVNICKKHVAILQHLTPQSHPSVNTLMHAYMLHFNYLLACCIKFSFTRKLAVRPSQLS